MVSMSIGSAMRRLPNLGLRRFISSMAAAKHPAAQTGGSDPVNCLCSYITRRDTIRQSWVRRGK